jgi:LacI family transcriptional regulator, galactose operon repressor
MPGTRPVTIGDVAALAGVSIGTVSKALNGRGQLRPQTRDRVLAASQQLGFRPSPLARGLLTGRSDTVGLITTDSFGRFTIPVMLGAEDALGQGQMSVLLCDGRGDPIREEHYVRTLLDGIGGQPAHGLHRQPCRLVIRESSRP